MKRIALLAMLALALTPFVAAQEGGGDHFTLGVFADYTRLKTAGNANLWGLGANLGFGVARHARLEAQMAYDFERQTVTSNGTSFNQTGLRVLHGLFGPTIYGGSGHFRLFGTVKGGFVNFSVSNGSPITGFTGAVSNITTGNTNGAFYPGGGIEFVGGPIGLRVEAGDLIFFPGGGLGAQNNLKVSFGPFFRF